jgi:hypothetical protein
VNHEVISKENMGKMKVAYDAHKAFGTGEEGETPGLERSFIVEFCVLHRRGLYLP